MKSCEVDLKKYTSTIVTCGECGDRATTLVCETVWGAPSLDKAKLVCQDCAERGERQGKYRRLSI